MIQLLAGWLISDHKNTSSPAVRRAYGVLCGAVGIGLNILLFFGKLFAGIFSGSVAITADAFNNLSDAGSSLITMIGFRLAGQKPDLEHPYGHGRLEYVSGLAVSMLIVLMGFELAKSSVSQIISPEPVSFRPLVAWILVASICVKLYMAYYNRSVGKKMNSAAMRATALDSISDCAATGLVLVSMLISYYFHINIDGWCGILVAGFILFSGYQAAKETISPLLGQPPEPEFVEEIHKLVMAHEGILGIHDLMVHDYGPGRRMISLHAEVPSTVDILEIHDKIDHIEKRLGEALDCEAVIHMDPIVVDDEITNQARQQMAELVADVDERMSIHDFRMVTGPTHTNVIFDILAPFEVKLSDEEIREEVCRRICSLPGNYMGVIQVDRDFLGKSSPMYCDCCKDVKKEE